jgi:hypothetical protein
MSFDVTAAMEKGATVIGNEKALFLSNLAATFRIFSEINLK